MESYLQYRALSWRLKTQLAQNGKETRSNSTKLECSQQQSVTYAPESEADSALDLGNPETANNRTTGSQVEDLLPTYPMVQSSEDRTLPIHAAGRLDSQSRSTIHDESLCEDTIVDFEGSNDPFNPRNWSIVKRGLITANLGAIALLTGFAGAIDSAALSEAANSFGVGELAESLATGLVMRAFLYPRGN